MENNIRKDNRKALPKFLLVLLGCGVLGGVLGFGVVYFKVNELEAAFTAGLNALLAAVTPWAIPVSSAVSLGGAWVLYRRAKRMTNTWDGEDEAAADAVENTLNWVLLLTTIQMLLNFLFFAAAVIYWVPGKLTIIAEIVCFLLSVGAVTLVQQKVVDLTRQLNPEKQGSVYDLRFKKKWLDSCDEAEQKQIGQAAYKAYSVVNTACPILWCVLVMLSFMLKFSLLPSFVVVLLWGILNITYIVECIRLSRRAMP